MIVTPEVAASTRRRVTTTAVVLVAAAGMVSAGGGQAGADATVSTWPQLQAAFSAGGTVALAGDISNPMGENLIVGSTAVTLDLQGHRLSVIAPGTRTAAIVVPASSSFTVSNSGHGGRLTAYGESGAAGIGGGPGGSAGSVTLSGASVRARGGSGAAGIGGGSGGAGGPVRLKLGGKVDATGGCGAAGIGGGGGGAGGAVAVNSSGSMTVTGGCGAAGVGGGNGGVGGSLTVKAGGQVTVTSGTAVGAGFGPFSNAGTMRILYLAGLVVPGGESMVNDGVLNLGGTADVEGSLTGVGTVHNAKAITGSGTIADDGQGPAGTALLVDVHNYTLGFDVNGGTGPAPETEHVYADTVSDGGRSLPAGPARPGYRFAGWFTAASGGTPVGTATSLSALLGAGPKTATLFAHYDLGAVPVVSSVSPSYGPTAGGGRVVVRGSGFTGATEVRFQDTPVSFVVNSDTQVTTSAPPVQSAGTANVRVRTPYGNSGNVPGDRYTYLAAPDVTSVTPSAGPLAGGNVVTISGSGFTDVSAVSFGDVPASSFKVLRPRELTAVVPAGSTGTVLVRVTAAGGTSGPRDYTYAPIPVIHGVSPKSGYIGGGSTVTLTGKGFTGVSAVFFGSSDYTVPVTVVSDGQLNVKAPAHRAGSVYIYVTTPGGTSGSNKAAQYVYVP